MSETTTELEDEGRAASEEQPETEGQPTAEGGEQQPQTEEKPKPERKQAQHLRARIAEVNRRAEEAEARAARAEALLAARGNGEEPAKDQPTTQEQIRAEAARLVAEQRVHEQRGQIIQAGVREFGAEEWNEKTEMLATMGALGRPEFMEALADLPDAHRVIVALADDPDQLSTLLAKRPAAMAAALGRMAGELSVDKPKQEISKVAAPVKPVTRTGREPPFKEPEPGTREWFNWRNQTAPKSLGGEGKAVA